MSRRGLMLFVAMCVVWGLPYLLIRISVATISPVFLVFARTAIGALLLLPVATARGEVRVVATRWRWLLAYSVIEIALPWVLLSDAETRITSSLSGLLVAAVPLVGVILVSASGRGGALGRTQVAGLLVGLGGVLAVLGLDLGSLSPLAALEMAVVVVCYSLGPQVLARRLSDLPGLGVVAASLGVCAVAYFPFAVLTAPTVVPDHSVLLAIGILGVVCTAGAFILFFQLIAEVGPIRATVVTYVNPAVAVLLGVMILHERFTLGIGAGFALILTGSILASRTSRSRRPPPLPRVIVPDG